MGNAECTVCAAGHYCPGFPDSRQLPCPANSDVGPGAKSWKECVCHWSFYCLMTNVSLQCVLYAVETNVTVVPYTGTVVRVGVPVVKGVAAFAYDLWGAGGGGGYKNPGNTYHYLYYPSCGGGGAHVSEVGQGGFRGSTITSGSDAVPYPDGGFYARPH
eukprot:3935110-Rhodomonas_salina.1